MKILIINMYSSKKRFDRFKKRFKNIFNGKSKLVFKTWNEVSSIIQLVKSGTIQGIILSGSDYRVKAVYRSIVPNIVFNSRIPLLGICYGYQYIVQHLSSKDSIGSFEGKKYHIYTKKYSIKRPFLVSKTKRFFYHHDYVKSLPKHWKKEITSKKLIYMAYNPNTKYIGIQFHPEKYIKTGKKFFYSWLKYICA